MKYYKGATHHRHIKRAKKAVRHPFAVPVLTFVILAIVCGLAYLVLNRSGETVSPNVVVISHDGSRQVVSSKEPTVGSLMAKLGLKLNEGDIVEPARETLIQQDDFRINIYRAAPVEIVDEGHRTFTFSASTASRTVASQAGLTLYAEDNLVKQPIRDFISSGGITEQVTVDRATPVNVNLYGTEVVMRTHATTIKQLLDERKIKLQPQDQVNPGLDTAIASAVTISVVRNGLSSATVEEAVPIPVQNIADNTLAYGTSAVRQKGAAGKRAVVYEINTQNGVEVSRRAIQTTIIQQPVTEIRVSGSNLSGIKGDMALAGISPNDYNYVDYIFTHESHWNPAAVNAGGCAGLGQACPGSKLAAVCPNWQNDPVCQIKFFNGYAVGRYKSWAAAYQFKVAKGWW